MSVDTVSAPALARLLEDLQARIIADDEVSPADDALLHPTRQGGPARIGIYREAYRVRLVEALGSNFPVLRAVLGDDEFEAVALAYLEAHPSRSPSIRWFGAGLTDWLEEQPGRVGHPSLIDLARMEWTLGQAFDGPDATPLEVGALAAIDPGSWPTLSFVGHPTVRVVPLNWNIEPHWKALSVDVHAVTEPPVEVAHHLLVWRGAEETQWRSLENDEAALLTACLAGAPFGELCASAYETHGDEAALRVAGLLRGWVEAGLFRAVAAAGSPA